MCAIIGQVSSEGKVNNEWVMHGRDAMSHRGPDDSGEWFSSDGRVIFGHRRLSIIDLSSAAHQPMQDASGVLTVVFNGEIYNYTALKQELISKGHSFRSQSDTEILLVAYKEWGIDFISKLNGMFVFALFDEAKQKVVIVRDRAGEKPLFYSLTKGVLRFSSELKGLLVNASIDRRINREALDCYLSMGFVPGGLCIIESMNKLPPAHALLFDLKNGSAKVWRYWQLPELDPNAEKSLMDESSLLNELEALLESAVSHQFVADVPVGVLLSGGVDSSLITAMAVRISNKVKTFTIGFPGHGKLDETLHARLIARHFGTEHVELEAQHTTVDLLPSLAHQFDEPIVDSSMIPTYLVSQLVQQHCKVALGGDGGDELFGGYNHYSRLLWMQNRLGFIPHPMRQVVSFVAEHVLPVGLKGRNWLQGLGVDLKKGLPLIASYFDYTTRRSLMGQQPSWPLVAESVLSGRIPQSNELLQRATRLDFSDYLAEDILVKVDRASMLNSLEIRAPFLDYRLIEFAFSNVPSRLKATAHNKKILLKRLATRVLPPEFDTQRKQGFSIPLTEWLKHGMFRDMFHDVLLDSQSIFDKRTTSKLLHNQDRGHSNCERLFALVLFELWRREYNVSL